MEQKGFTLWFTGLSGSGKTKLANMVADRLKARGMMVERLDGDVVRKSLTRDLGFSREDRYTNIERVTFVAKLLSRNGVVVTTAFISPYIDMRQRSREEIDDFVEVYVKCSLEECERRDIKGMYAKARAGEIKEFTGISDPYEEPPNPEILVETDKQTEEESLGIIMNRLVELGYLEAEAAAQEQYYTPEEEEKIKQRLKDLGYY